MSKGSGKNAPQKHIIKVHGVTDKMKNTLERLSHQKFGKSSVSNTVKEIVRMYIANHDNPTKIEYDPNATLKGSRLRLEVKVRSEEYEYLRQMAELHETTSNQIVASLIRNLVAKYPTLSTAEINAVRLSNIRLLQIGRNLNQIAKQLNSMGGATITTQHIDNLLKEINQHTEKVGELIVASRKHYAE